MKNLPLKAVLLAVLCNIIFGSGIPVTKLGYAEFGVNGDIFSTILFAGCRFLISGVVLFIISSLREKKIPLFNKDNVADIFTVAVTYTFLQYFFYYVALSELTGSKASILTATSAFFAVILAHFIYPDDKLNLVKIVGTVIGFAGVWLASSTDDLSFSMTFMGDGLLLIAEVFFVVGSVFNKKATAKEKPFTVSSYNLLIGGFLLIVAGLIGYRGGMTITFKGILLLLYLVFVSSFGFTLWSYLLSKYPVGKLGVYIFVIPVSGGIISGIVLKENILSIKTILAFLLVSVGIIIVNSKKVKTNE